MTYQERAAAVEARYKQLTDSQQQVQVELHRLEGEYRLLQALAQEESALANDQPPMASGQQQKADGPRPSHLTLVPEPAADERGTGVPSPTVAEMLQAGRDAWMEDNS